MGSTTHNPHFHGSQPSDPPTSKPLNHSNLLFSWPKQLIQIACPKNFIEIKALENSHLQKYIACKHANFGTRETFVLMTRALEMHGHDFLNVIYSFTYSKFLEFKDSHCKWTFWLIDWLNEWIKLMRTYDIPAPPSGFSIRRKFSLVYFGLIYYSIVD